MLVRFVHSIGGQEVGKNANEKQNQGYSRPDSAQRQFNSADGSSQIVELMVAKQRRRQIDILGIWSRKCELPADRRIVLFVGRIEPLKGIDTLLRAMALLAPELPGIL